MMTMDKLTNEVIRHVLWYFGDHEYGWEAGRFTYHLMCCFQRADPDNYLHLSVGFPAYAEAMRVAMREEGGMETLRAILSLVEARD